jgi:hypothetical protein
VSEFVRLTKGSTSHYLTRDPSSAELGWFGWRAEYGMRTFGKKALPRVVAYVENQAQHHRLNTLWPALERLGDSSGPRSAASSDDPASHDPKGCGPKSEG